MTPDSVHISITNVLVFVCVFVCVCVNIVTAQQIPTRVGALQISIIIISSSSSKSLL